MSALLLAESTCLYTIVLVVIIELLTVLFRRRPVNFFLTKMQVTTKVMITIVIDVQAIAMTAPLDSEFESETDKSKVEYVIENK